MTHENETGQPVTTGPSLDALAKFVDAQETGIPVDIKGPDGKSIGLKITVYGPDSTQVDKALDDVTKIMEAEALAGTSDEDPRRSADRRTTLILARSCKSWDNNPVFGGKTYEFSVENLEFIFDKFRIIRDQVEVVAFRRGSFSIALSASSV